MWENSIIYLGKKFSSNGAFIGFPQDREKALYYYMLAADQHNDIEAHHTIGVMYIEGEGVEKNAKEGEKHLLFAANNGYLKAQRLLGKIYLSGESDVCRNTQRAFHYYKLAADQNDDEGKYYTVSLCNDVANNGQLRFQKILGEIYFLGLYGQPKNDQKAFCYFKLAADQHNDIDAKYNVGWMYIDGIGTNKNDVEGVKYLESAAVNGHITAQNTLGKMYYDGRGVSQDYQKSFYFFKLAADQRDAGSEYALACMHIQGEHLEKNLTLGITCLEHAATRGYLKAQKFLGEIYFTGEYGLSKDYEKALQHYTLAVDQHDDADSKYYICEIIKLCEREASKGQLWFQKFLGKIYLSGEYGISQDYKKAFQQYKSAADQHADAESKYNVGWMYIKGIGTDKNDVKGVECLESAVIKGYLKAQTMLGRLYSEGRYVNKDDKRSLYFFKLAADQGDVDSQCIVGNMYIHGAGGDKNIQEGERYRTLARNSGYSSISK